MEFCNVFCNFWHYLIVWQRLQLAAAHVVLRTFQSWFLKLFGMCSFEHVQRNVVSGRFWKRSLFSAATEGNKSWTIIGPTRPSVDWFYYSKRTLELTHASVETEFPYLVCTLNWNKNFCRGLFLIIRVFRNTVIENNTPPQQSWSQDMSMKIEILWRRVRVFARQKRQKKFAPNQLATTIPEMPDLEPTEVWGLIESSRSLNDWDLVTQKTHSHDFNACHDLAMILTNVPCIMICHDLDKDNHG